MKTRVLFTFLLLCLGTIAQSFAQTLIAWRPTTAVGEGSLSSYTTHALLQTGTLDRGEGAPTLTNSTLSYVSKLTNTTTKAEATTANAYFEVVIQAKVGAVLSLSSLTAKLRRGNTSSPNQYRWMYSIDNWQTYAELGTGDVTMTTHAGDGSTNATDGALQNAIDLSGVSALQNIPSSTKVIFRLYAWGGSTTSNNANFGFGKANANNSSDAPNANNALVGSHVLVFTGTVTMPIAQTPILAWRPPSATEDVVLAADDADVNMDQAQLSRGTGLTFSSSSTYTYTSIFPQHASKAAAASAGAYYQVVMKAKEGYYLNLNGLISRIRRSSATAVNSYRWVYSLKENPTDADFTDVGPDDVILTTHGSASAGGDTNGEDQYFIDLSSVAELHNVPSSTTVTFRCYMWGATANNTNTGFGKSYVNSTDYNSLAFYGSVASTLPVKLTSFKGKVEGRTVKLNWTTASEQNNVRFEVLRSSTGKPTAVIGTVNGNGTSNANHHYNFIDNKPLLGTNYYQLRQVDNDGKSELSEIIAVATDLKNAKVTVTATQTEVIAQLYSNVKISGKLYISDLSGKTLVNTPVVLNENINNVLAVPFTAVKGIYILQLVTADGVRLSSKFYK